MGKRRMMVLGVWLGLLFWVGGPVFAQPVPDTGQTKCYDDEGYFLISCPSPGQPFYGQDANYTINPPSYTKLDSNRNTVPDSANSWTMVHLYRRAYTEYGGYCVHQRRLE